MGPSIPLLSHFARPVALALAALAVQPAVTANTAPVAPAKWHVSGTWRPAQGLPQDTVYALLHATDGYLWIGTRAGLTRFDGVNFTTYDDRDQTQLRENEVWAIEQGVDNTLWIATYGSGLTHMKEGRFTHYTTAHGLKNDFVTEMAAEPDGTVWVGTDFGLCLLKDGRFTEFPVENGGASFAIRAIHPAASGTKWIGGSSHLLYRVQGDRLVGQTITGLIPGSEIRAIVEDKEGFLWVGTNVGLARLKGETVTWFTAEDGLSSDRVRRLLLDPDGAIWVGTVAGVDRIEKGSVQAVASSPSLVHSLVRDREGGIWFGSVADGLTRLHKGQFTSYTMQDGLSAEYVTAVMEDSKGNMWVGCTEGINLLRDGRFTTHFPNDALNSKRVSAFLEKRDGEIWVGMETGVFRFRYDAASDLERRGPRFIPVPVPDLPLVFARGLYEDRHGNVWIGTHTEGLIRVAPSGETTLFTTAHGLGNDAIRGLCEDRAGNLWIGTRGGGLTYYRDGVFTTYGKADGLASDVLQTMYCDKDDTLWIATRHGLTRRKDGKFSSFTTRDGLFANHCYGIAEDRLGNLWMSCARGIFSVKKSDLDLFAAGKLKKLECDSYGLEHGLSSTAATAGNYPGAYQASDGRMWFGMLRGLCVIDPARAVRRRHAPAVHIENAAVDDVNFNLHRPIEAPPGRGDLAFRYTGTSFHAPEKIRFRYRLEGFDADWIDAGSRREAFYSRVPPGSYVFKVTAANNDGPWNEIGSQIAVTIKPHLYQMVWFRMGSALLVVAGFTAAYTRRVRHIRSRARELEHQNQELERRVAERTTELAKSYETLRASEYFYSSLVESLPQAIARKDARGRFTYVNKGFADLIGLGPSEIIGQIDYELCPQLADRHRADDLRAMQTREAVEYEEVVERPGRPTRYLHVKKIALVDDARNPIGVQVMAWDRTTFRETEEKLRTAQRELIETSRLAGIAEVATGVLHNIGNALNSVNTSATVAAEQVRKSKLPSLERIARLLLDQGDRLPEFYASDPRARQLPQFLAELSSRLQAEQDTLSGELDALRTSIEHIKEIVAAQQGHARAAGVVEEASAAELAEHALRISEAALARHKISVARDFKPSPILRTERQKVLQILVNLIGNAKESLNDAHRPDRQLWIAVEPLDDGQRVAIRVRDNGVGIAPEVLPRLFAFGFTTKKRGHGFGLHSSALAARELGGTLTAESDGLGRGATFVLTLPQEHKPKAAEPEQVPQPEAAAQV